MLLTNVAKLLWLLCTLVSDSASSKTPLYPPCCPACKSVLCPGFRSLTVRATNALGILGAIDVVHDGTSTTVQALADLTTRRNFITSTLVDDIKLDGKIQKFSDIDVHSIEISGRNVTITTFVRLSIGIGIDNKLITDKIFGIIPEQKSYDSDLTTSDLVLGLSFLNDAGALGINQAVFTTGY